MDAAALRAEFPVLANIAYLNAGTDGPVPARAVCAAAAEVERQAADGRFHAHFERRAELAGRQRAAYAALLGASPEDVALTSSTSEGIGTVVAGLALEAGDEILTSEAEHPGLIGPLWAAQRQQGVTVRQVPLARIAEEIGPRTRLVACSHVHWKTGELAPAGLPRAAGAAGEVPVLLDGAQGVGAVPVDVATLGCDAYAGSGQKWLCGPDGTGMLYLSPAFAEAVAATAPSWASFADAGSGLDAELHPGARRHDMPSLAAEASAFALAALEVLGEHGWPAVHRRAAALAARLADELAAGGFAVLPRGPCTLVGFEVRDAPAAQARLADAGVVVRELPGTSCLRASVGAWNDEADLERVLGALGAGTSRAA